MRLSVICLCYPYAVYNRAQNVSTSLLYPIEVN